MLSISTLLAAGFQGRKRKLLGDITTHLNAQETKKKLKGKNRHLAKANKLVLKSGNYKIFCRLVLKSI